MIKDIQPEEIETVKKNLESFPSLKEIFKKDFIDSLLKIEGRLKKHQLFWILSDLSKTAKLSNNLSILKSKLASFQTIVNKLVNDKDRDNFYSAISEMEVLSYFYSSFPANSIEYEPPIQNKTGKPDLKLTVNSEEYYIEIFNLRDDITQREINETQDKIKEEIDKIVQPFLIMFSTELYFKQENIEEFVSFVKSLVEKKELITPGNKFDFLKENVKFADVEFFESKSKNGHVCSMLHPVRVLNESSRIKTKILTKIDKQIPIGKKSILVLDNTYAFHDNFEVLDAIYGLYCFIVNPETHEIIETRQPNGVIHHPKGKDVSGIISCSGDFSKRRFFLNPFATCKLGENEIGLFASQEVLA